MPSKHQYEDLSDELSEISVHRIRNAGSRPGKAPSRKAKQPATKPRANKETPFPAGLSSQGADSLAEIGLSYNASRHERGWIIDSLSDFYDQQWFFDILRLIKGGKEASVYLCAAKPDLQVTFLAAKVYRPRRFRNLKNDHIYREGRENLDENGNVITNSGMLHAIRKRSDYGLQLTHTAWIEYEYRTLQILHQAGADVPAPYTRGNNAILMSYIGDEDLPAPVLQEVRLSQAEARRRYERRLHNVEILLDHNLIHGDLSAYAILYWEGNITLIDFPQVLNPDQNVNAYWIFERDINRLCEYFTTYNIRPNPHRLAASLWKARGRRIDHLVEPAYLDADRPEDRRYWKRVSEGSH